jgi:hypothetical protein
MKKPALIAQCATRAVGAAYLGRERYAAAPPSSVMI